MALVNDVKREINAKIVYVGPKGSGKTTALRYIYGKLKPEYRSELKSTPLGDHQLVFFDFAYPQPSRVDGYFVRFHLYTILIGSGSSVPPWKMLLKGADGVVFLADSADGRMEDNIASSALLYDALAHYGIGMGDIPVSIQCNKRDLPEALPPVQIAAETFPELCGSVMPVTAATGEGLLEGLQKLVKEILQKLGQSSVTPADVDEDELTVVDKPVELYRSEASGASAAAGFSVESAGNPVMLESGVLSVPLRLIDAEGECKAEFSIGITIKI
ncbi:MAG TPA: ADP-ribosylation factor-like protein [Geobacteraceae bacterium]|nr:ADP-ribosylation factor-like protein [Geobacteraceae bacterium]